MNHEDEIQKLHGRKKYHQEQFCFNNSKNGKEEEESNNTVSVIVQYLLQLPPADAVGLLSGEDHTGLLVWEGCLQCCQYLCQKKENDPIIVVQQPSGRSDAQVFVELGAGAGLCSLVIHQLLQQRMKHPQGCCATTIVATDGNEECVELLKANLKENDHQEIDGKVLKYCAVQLQWGEPVLPTALRNILSVEKTDSEDKFHVSSSVEPSLLGNLLIVSADVIYSTEAIDPLFQTVKLIAQTAAVHMSSTLRWILVFMNRAWSESIYQTQRQKIAEKIERENWKLEEKVSIAEKKETTDLINSHHHHGSGAQGELYLIRIH